MAIRELNAVVVQNYDVAKDASFQAGACLVQNPHKLEVMPADRSLSATAYNTGTGAFPHDGNAFVGFAADDKARTGNTMIIPDPVGSSVVSADGTTFTANNNAFYVATKRALGDYQDESVSNVSDLTSGSTGYQGPRRGIGVFATPSGEFVTDQFVAVETSSGTADSGSAYVFLPNDILTFGAGANKGKLVHLAGNATTHGPAVAKVRKYDSTAGLLYITQL